MQTLGGPPWGGNTAAGKAALAGRRAKAAAGRCRSGRGGGAGSRGSTGVAGCAPTGRAAAETGSTGWPLRPTVRVAAGTGRPPGKAQRKPASMRTPTSKASDVQSFPRSPCPERPPRERLPYQALDSAIGRHEGAVADAPWRGPPWRGPVERRKARANSHRALVLPRYDFRSPRLYVEAALKPGADVTLDKSQAHYLRNVLRLKPGDGVLAFNGTRRRMAGDAGRRRQAHGACRCRSRRVRRPRRATCITCSRRSSMSGSTTWCRRRSRWASRGCSRC